MNRIVTVQTCPGNETSVWIGRSWNHDETLITAVGCSWMPRPVVAVLAKVWNPFIQQLGVGRAVRSITRQAVFFDCPVLEEEWSALVCMAAPALKVHCFLLHRALAHRAVRIVAAGAGDFALLNRVVGRLIP